MCVDGSGSNNASAALYTATKPSFSSRVLFQVFVKADFLSTSVLRAPGSFLFHDRIISLCILTVLSFNEKIFY